jgi:hypothetical protein
MRFFQNLPVRLVVDAERHVAALNQAICQRNPVFANKKGRSAYNNAMPQADLIQLQRDAAKYAGLYIWTALG